MKMVMLTYNEAIDVDVMEVVNSCGLQNYTKITRVVHGKGTASKTHMGNEVWPGLNYIMFVACDDKQADQIVVGIKKLRPSLAKEGLKAFVMPLEQIA